MFDLFRSREKNSRVLLGVMLGLVAISMLIYLIPGGVGGGSATGDNVVATVDGEKITATDVQRSLQNITRGQNLPKDFWRCICRTSLISLSRARRWRIRPRRWA